MMMAIAMSRANKSNYGEPSQGIRYNNHRRVQFILLSHPKWNNRCEEPLGALGFAGGPVNYEEMLHSMGAVGIGPHQHDSSYSGPYHPTG